MKFTIAAVMILALSAGAALASPESEISAYRRSHGLSAVSADPALSTLAAGHYMDYTLVLAGTAMATLPVLVVFAVFGRRIIGGIMEGAVKG